MPTYYWIGIIVDEANTMFRDEMAEKIEALLGWKVCTTSVSRIAACGRGLK